MSYAYKVLVTRHSARTWMVLGFSLMALCYLAGYASALAVQSYFGPTSGPHPFVAPQRPAVTVVQLWTRG